ncbi:hypothetical protein X943_002222 [Babesia divergens]|uniref:Uncharacterized protein n=1 Tax=Babesia divergens TaxID=32595 RepID=A0AAD9GDA2_BABDI|nr:hypothetical protein X943_002222 [Babesia divergens]
MSSPDGKQALLKEILKRSPSTPNILWWQATEILYKLQRRQQPESKRHPCVSTWHKLVRCMRRFPHNMTSKCSGEASRHYQCTLNNDDWDVEDSINYTRILDFNIFNKRKPMLFNAEEIERQGTATTNQFVPTRRYKSREK